MTGPPYPPVDPTISEIGKFIIGVSPIGDIPFFNPWTTVISQYSNSPIIDAMITDFGDAMDQTTNMANFFDMMWNVLTAQGYGLDVWGRIVGVTRTTNFATDTDFRVLILAKAFGNISDGSIISINAILMTLFGTRGNVYIVDTGNMQMTVTCNAPPDVGHQLSLLTSFLPYPAGVTVTILLVLP